MGWRERCRDECPIHRDLVEEISQGVTELASLRGEVAVACQSAGTALTMNQPEAIMEVQRVCALHPSLSDEVRRLTNAIEILAADEVISAGRARELHGMTIEQQRAFWRVRFNEGNAAIRRGRQ